MWVSSGVEWRTEPMRISCGGLEVVGLRLWRKRAKERRRRGWFFSGRNWAMYRIEGSRVSRSVVRFTSMPDSSSVTATGGKRTVGSLCSCSLSWREGPQREVMCALVQEELHITTSIVPPTQP